MDTATIMCRMALNEIMNKGMMMHKPFLHVYTDIMTNDFYTVSCAIVQNQNQKELFDNEHTKYRKVKMGDVEALLGEDKNTGYYLVWEDEGITHTIIGRISIRELMLVAQKIY